jgi:DHA2 family lincomycin resistance protein-like MFS transporter
MSSAPAVPEKLPAAHSRLIALLVISTFVVILNETIMSVALPELMRDLDIPATTAQWLTTGFLLTMAVVIPVTGFLLQRFQIRQIYIAAMTAFSIGTLIAALAPGFEVLLIGRIVQAVGTALMLPLLITTVMTLVPEARRGQMMGTITIVIAVAPAIGPTISGVVLEVLDWRWMFWFVLPIALTALATGARWVQNVTAPQGAHLDALSVVLSAIGFSGIVYGLSSIGEAAQGETPLPPAVPLVIGVVGLGLFAWRQLRLGDRALLDLRVFASPLFPIAALLSGLSMLTLLGALIVLPLYLQDVLDLSTLTTGLILLPGGLAMGLLGPFVGRAYDRIGPRPLVVPAAGVLVVALGLMATLDQSSPVGFVIAAHVLLSIGLAMMLTPLMTTALGAVPPQRYSHGSAIVSTLQQVCGAAGAAIFITVMTRRATSISDAGTQDPAALAEGVQSAMLVGVGLAVTAGIVALFLRRPKTPEMPPASGDDTVIPADPRAAAPVVADEAEERVSV